MTESDLLSMLRCPDDRSQLRLADNALIARINDAIRAGRLRNEAGRELDETIDGGLIRAHGDLLYPILDGIPVLLRDEAIEITNFTTPKLPLPCREGLGEGSS